VLCRGRESVNSGFEIVVKSFKILVEALRMSIKTSSL
jgi:hypothetical protein